MYLLPTATNGFFGKIHCYCSSNRFIFLFFLQQIYTLIVKILIKEDIGQVYNLYARIICIYYILADIYDVLYLVLHSPLVKIIKFCINKSIYYKLLCLQYPSMLFHNNLNLIVRFKIYSLCFSCSRYSLETSQTASKIWYKYIFTKRCNFRYLPPLANIDRLYHPRDFIDECDCSSDVVYNFYISYLFPRHGHVLQKLQYGMWHVLQSTIQRKQHTK